MHINCSFLQASTTFLYVSFGDWLGFLIGAVLWKVSRISGWLANGQLRRSEWFGIPSVNSSKIARKVGLMLEGRVSANWSADLNLGLRVSGRVYFSFVVIRIVAVTRHLVQGNLAAGIGCRLGIIFGLGLNGKRSAVFAAYVCFCGPDFLLMLARKWLFRIWVCSNVVRKRFPISLSLRLSRLRMLQYASLLNSGRWTRGSW